jgi:Flp pilus assembly pilin Flp
MRSILRRFAAAQSGATSIETAGMAVVSVVLIVMAAKTVGTRVVTSFDQSVGNAFGTSEPAVKEGTPSRPCRITDERERPECRIR